MITIHEPIWNIGYFVKGYKGRGVGINKELVKGTIKVKISYLNMFKKEMFPSVYEISANEALKFPTKRIKMIQVITIPLSAMKEVSNV